MSKLLEKFKANEGAKILVIVSNIQDKFNINNFFLRCDDKLNKIMRPALELLENMQLLTYQNVYMIAKEVPVTRGTDVVIHEAATEEETRYRFATDDRIVIYGSIKNLERLKKQL